MSAMPCSPASLPEASSSSSEDTIRSFKLFLDLITPAEFSKLLRARVKHLLQTWPPLNETTLPSGSNIRHGPSCSTFESICAFTAFFRSQDTPGPPHGDVSATSLSTLQHQLLALQTLLSFLSGRELKDIVRARLGEDRKDRMVAVRGLIDIMRNGDGEEDEEAEAVNSAGFNGHIEGEDGDRSGETNGPAIAGETALPSGSKRKSPARTRAEMNAQECEEEQPPKKRQRIITSQHNPAKGASLSSNPPLTIHFEEQRTPPLTLSNLSRPLSHLSTPSNTSSAQTNINENKSSPSPGALKPRSEPNAQEEELTVVHLTDVDMEISDPETRANPDDSEEEDEVGGLVVTLIGDEENVPTPQVGSPGQGGSQATAGERQPHSISHTELEKSEQLTTNESPSTTLIAANSMSHDSTFGVDPIHASPSPLPRLSRSPSFQGSDLDSRASPPGPLLHTAVDWASSVIPSSIDLDIGGEEGSDDTLALGTRDVFDFEYAKPAVGFYAGRGEDISDTVAKKGSDDAGTGAVFDFEWQGEDVSDTVAKKGSDDTGTRAVFDYDYSKHAFHFFKNRKKDVAKVSQSSRSSSDDGSSESDASSSEQPRKLYIRLPARPKSKMASAGGASSASSEKGGKEAAQSLGSPESLTFGKEGKQPIAAEAVPKKSITTPAVPSPQPQSQSAPTSRTQSASPIMMNHNGHHYSVPPHHRHAAPFPHPHPYPWFGAMFYLPVRHPHPGMQRSFSKVPSLSAAGPVSLRGAVARVKDQGLGSESVSVSASGSSPASADARKRPPKRKSSVEPELEDAPPSPPVLAMEVDDPNVTYTDDVGVKESLTVRRRCYNCRGVQAPSWRKSKLTAGKILCNKCGIYETTHMSPRPLKTRPRRSQGGADGSPTGKKRKSPKKVVQ